MMDVECPKCKTENPADSKFCKECATPLSSDPEIFVSQTKTLVAVKEELTTGSIFAGRYQIIEELGKGGMGRVYKALDTKIDEKIALKLIKPEIATDKKTIERFGNELKYARKIRHKNVCHMYDLGEEKGNHFITMEFVEGEDLKSMIRMSGQLSTGMTIKVAKQICDGLSEAHKLGMIHRDLKPGNVMIDKNGNARIMDFGLVRSLKAKSITGAGVMIGTPEYMSPEQVEGKEIDKRSDLYSLGVALYEMVTGQVPFEGDTPFTIGVKHKSEIPQEPKKINDQIPDDLNLLIMKCLEKDKDRRYQSADEIRSDLENIEKGLPTAVGEIPKKRPLTSREITVTLGMKKLLVPVAILLGIFVAALVVWQVFLKGVAPLAPEERPSIAVISFENQTGDDSFNYLRRVIPNLLITNLEQSGYFNVTTWERLKDLMGQKGFTDVEFIEKDLGFELCQMENVDAIILGSFAKAGDVFATDVKVLDVDSKKLLKSVSSKGEGEGSILRTQIDELSSEIATGIGIPKRKVEESPVRIADLTTNSIEAYNYFLRGLDQFDKFLLIDARDSFLRSVGLDPNFAVAHYYLARSYAYLGNEEGRLGALEQAKIHSEKATEKERMLIDAYYAAQIDRNFPKQIHILEEIVRKYPKEKDTLTTLGISYYRIGRDDAAIEVLNSALELDPNYGRALNMIAYTYSHREDYEKALDYFERYAAASPRDPNPFDSMAETYFRMGRLDDAIETYKKALEIVPNFGSSIDISYIYALKEDYETAHKWIDRFITNMPVPGMKADGHLWKGYLYFLQGSRKLAFEEFAQALGYAHSVENKWRIATIEWIKAMVYYETGDYEFAQNFLKSATDFMIVYQPEKSAQVRAIYASYLALMDLKIDKVESARSKLDEVHSILADIPQAQKKEEQSLYETLLAEVLLAEGSIDEAIKVCLNIVPMDIPGMNTDELGSYNRSIPRDTLARAYYKKGELDKAIEAYERIVTYDPNGTERRFLHPRYHYLLAKLYEEKGLSDKAVAEYEKFLKLWKLAEPGEPEAKDAKKSLKQLR
jgi:serine/threonine protein kinase/tetratricopeptide (TPR) repeat protein